VLSRHRPRLVALDGNLSEDDLTDVVRHCIGRNIPSQPFISSHRRLYRVSYSFYLAWFEPTSILKATRIIPTIQAHYSIDSDPTSCAPITYASPNIQELEHIFNEARGTRSSGVEGPLSSSPRWFGVIDSFQLGSNFSDDLSRLGAPFLVQRGVAQMTIQLLPFFQHLVVKCGDQGAFICCGIRSRP
jgi:pseudouridylate synthase / pseudouridine kinase